MKKLRLQLTVIPIFLILLSGCQIRMESPSQPTLIPTAPTATPTEPAAPTAITETEPITTPVVTDTTSVVTNTQTMTDTEIGTATSQSANQSSAQAELPSLAVDMTDMTIAEIISTTTGFATLATALETAGLLDLLDAPGPLTLFAPTDSAFALYTDETMAQLLAAPALLNDLLQYHVVVDRASAAQLIEIAGALTASEEVVDVTLDADGAYYVNDAVIIQADIQAANGLIHVINGLLVPSAAESLLTARTLNPEAETNTDTRSLTLEQLAAVDTSDLTVLDVISSIDGFTTLTAAVNAAGLNDALNTGGPITLLAPTNGAFAAMTDFELEVYLNTQIDELVRILQYHTILDGVTSADLAQLGTALTATGAPVTVTVNNNGVITLNNGAATVFMADIEASNGVIHAISAVLMPPPVE